MRMLALAMIALTLHPALAQQPPANTLPPGVTPEMEKDFITRYEAALKAAKTAKDPSGLKDYYALFANDPKIDPQGQKAFEDLVVIAAALDAAGTNPTYKFVPLTVEDAKTDDKSVQLAGKMYGGYLPPVISMKVTFAPPEHADPNGFNPTGTSHPLCIENGRLMLAGVKEIPGAVPPPMDNPADNFGLTPTHLKDGDTDDDNDFASLDKFVGALKQPSVQVLTSGQCDYVYYALCRIKPGLFVFVTGDRPGKENFSYMFPVTDSSNTPLKADDKQVTLAEDPPGLDGKPVPILQGQVYQLATGYTGPINVAGKFGNDFSNMKQGFSTTINWK